MSIIGRILLEIAWHLGIVHVPDWDNTPDPWPEQKKPDPIPDRPSTKDKPNTITKNLGVAEYGQTQKKITLAVTQGAPYEWDYSRWDGTENTMDFTEWSDFDDRVINERKYTTITRKNYVDVRQDVLAGMTNRQIATKHGKKIRWAEEYAGAVREMCRLREQYERLMATTKTSSPTE